VFSYSLRENEKFTLRIYYKTKKFKLLQRKVSSVIENRIPYINLTSTNVKSLWLNVTNDTLESFMEFVNAIVLLTSSQTALIALAFIVRIASPPNTHRQRSTKENNSIFFTYVNKHNKTFY